MKKLLYAILAVGMFVSTSMAAEVLAGGAIPLINNVLGVGTMTCDFSTDGNDVQIAYLILNNNSQEFDLDITSANDGAFICDALEVTLGVGKATVAMTLAYLDELTGVGTLGDDQATSAPVPPAPLTTGEMLTEFQASATFNWNYLQETATINYGIGVYASWLAFPGLAGLYTESFTIAITATL